MATGPVPTAVLFSILVVVVAGLVVLGLWRAGVGRARGDGAAGAPHGSARIGVPVCVRNCCCRRKSSIPFSAALLFDPVVT